MRHVLTLLRAFWAWLTSLTRPASGTPADPIRLARDPLLVTDPNGKIQTVWLPSDKPRIRSPSCCGPVEPLDKRESIKARDSPAA